MTLDTAASIAPPAKGQGVQIFPAEFLRRRTAEQAKALVLVPVAVPAAPVKPTSTRQIELEFPPAEIEPDFSPVLAILRDRPGVRFVVTGDTGGARAIVANLSHRRRHDRFTIHVSPERRLAWIGDQRFFSAEPSNRTSTDFLNALVERIDAFFTGVASLAGGRDDG